MNEMENNTEWWQTFFYGPWQDVQLAGYPEEQTQAEVSFMISALHLDGGARILDVPCGQGRHSIAFAKAGFKATGIDFNANAIEQARKTAADQNIPAEFVVADMREFSGRIHSTRRFAFMAALGTSTTHRTFVSRRACRKPCGPAAAFLSMPRSQNLSFRSFANEIGIGCAKIHLYESSKSVDGV